MYCMLSEVSPATSGKSDLQTSPTHLFRSASELLKYDSSCRPKLSKSVVAT
jgi:hypothetical protein